MSTNGETADLMVRECIQITESATKLTGLGAKNLAALLLALANDKQKLVGKTSLRKLLESNEELVVFSVPENHYADFKVKGKQYGVLYCPVKNRDSTDKTIEIISRARDAKQINRILEQMNIAEPIINNEKEVQRTPSRSELPERENGSKVHALDKDVMPEKKESVYVKVNRMKTRLEQEAMKKTPMRDKAMER